MLRKILDANDGSLPEETHAVFADTGREFPQTHEFLDEIERRWSVRIERVSRPGGFGQLIREKKFLPNQRYRFCTQHLKVVPMQQFMATKYPGEAWLNVVGFRADERLREAALRGNKLTAEWDHHFPLIRAGATKEDVMRFWSEQPFDLQLRPRESNCELCFLKGASARVQIVADHPSVADWWLEQERLTGGTWTKRESVSQIVVQADALRRQLPLFPEKPDDHYIAIDCFCGD